MFRLANAAIAAATLALLPVAAFAGDGCATNAVPAAAPNQNFTPWSGVTSPGNVWRINGPWVGTGNNYLEPSLAQLSDTFDNMSGGYLSLTVPANKLEGSEIQTLAANPGYGYGRYEVCMKPSSVSGVVASFFWIEAPGYGPHEWDIEFLTPDFSGNKGAVHFTVHPANETLSFPLNFNPSSGFHRYGFTWTPGKIVFNVDGSPAQTVVNAVLNTTATGYIMMNSWTGNPNWGGGPPNQNATSVYAWARFAKWIAPASASH
jgi:beta-glucanase (GH16 family)